MSGPEIVASLSYLGAASLGSAVGAGIAYWVSRTQRRMALSAVRAIGQIAKASEPGDHVVDGAGDREAEAMLNAHVTAVRYQVEQFADALAAGDPLLRARLRRLEHQMQRGA